MTRKEVLEKALSIVEGTRDDDGREDSFGMIADLWGLYLDTPLNETDVCMMMALLKIARVKCRHNVADSLIDIAGYAACAAGKE